MHYDLDSFNIWVTCFSSVFGYLEKRYISLKFNYCYHYVFECVFLKSNRKTGMKPFSLNLSSSLNMNMLPGCIASTVERLEDI